MDAPGYGKPSHEYGQPLPADLDPEEAEVVPGLLSERPGSSATPEIIRAGMDQAWAGPGFTKPNEESSP